MINIFILSIFDRLREKVKFIDYKRFTQMIGMSVLGSEIIDIIKTPFDRCLGRVSACFETQKATDDELKVHYETRCGLLRILN